MIRMLLLSLRRKQVNLFLSLLILCLFFSFFLFLCPFLPLFSPNCAIFAIFNLSSLLLLCCSSFLFFPFLSGCRCDPQMETLNPVWNIEIRVGVVTPTMADLIAIQVWDYDKSGYDDLIGTAFLRFSDLLRRHKKALNRCKRELGFAGVGGGKQRISRRRQKLSQKNLQGDEQKQHLLRQALESSSDAAFFSWINLYGAPSYGGGQLESQMARAMVDGTDWLGRILVDARIEPVPASAFGAKNGVKLVRSVQPPPSESYQLQVDLYELCETPFQKDKFYFVVKHGHITERSKKTHAVRNGHCEIHCAIPTIEQSLPKITDKVSLGMIPDIFIEVWQSNMMRSDDRIGVVRLPVHKVLNIRSPPQWFHVSPDKFCSDMERHELAGFLLASVHFGISKEMKQKPRADLSPSPEQKYELRAFVYQAKGLRAADETGLSDPYLIIRCGKESRKTRVIPETTSPMWYEIMSFPVSLPQDLSLAPDINVRVYDRFVVPLLHFLMFILLHHNHHLHLLLVFFLAFLFLLLLVGGGFFLQRQVDKRRLSGAFFCSGAESGEGGGEKAKMASSLRSQPSYS